MNPSIFETVGFGLRQKISCFFLNLCKHQSTNMLFVWLVSYIFWFQEQHFKFVIIKKFIFMNTEIFLDEML